MGSKNFRILLILRITGLVLATGLLLYCLFIQKNIIRSVFAFFLVSGLAAELYFFLSRVYSDVSIFLTALLNNDFTVYRLRRGKKKPVAGIYDLFHQISSKFNKIRTEKEVQHLFLQTLVEQVDIGIICFEEDGKIFLVNRAFKDLVQSVPIHSLARLEERTPDLYLELKRIRSGERRLVKYFSRGEIFQVSLICSEFKLMETGYKLITLQNIGQELDEKEIESWQKLIRVLTHEIMNSVTPITSLTGSLYERVLAERENQQAITSVTIDFLTEGLEAIAIRSKGLLGFTQAFHDLLRIPMPVIDKVETHRFFERIHLLFQPLFRERQIAFSSHIEKGAAWIYADASLMEQAVINLVKNAIESLNQTPKPSVSLQAISMINGRTHLIVSDNGKGIPVTHLDKIFVPFYTTKEKGTGIGLSLSRQIVQLHRGTLTVKSIPDVETSFVIDIP